jgi:group I intron endonuclease
MENQRKIKDYSQAKIYKIINSANNNIYVGSTCSKLCKRMAEHRRASISKRDKDTKFYKSVNEIGVEHFRIILVKEFSCDNNNQLVAEEYKVMKEMKENGLELYNDFIGEMSEEQRKKIGDAHRGKTHSEEHCKKVGDAHRGKTLSEEHKQKISEANKGEKHPQFSYGSISYVKKDNRWRFYWKENNKQKSKSFSIKRYGEEEAKRLCEEYRKKIYPESVDESQYVEIEFLD